MAGFEVITEGPREPQARTRTEAPQRLATPDCEEGTTCVQDDWCDMDCGTNVRLARPESPAQQRLRVQGADIGDHDRHRQHPSHAEPARAYMTLSNTLIV